MSLAEWGRKGGLAGGRADARYNFRNLRGRRIGRCIVVEPSGSHPRRGVIWLCRCDCGQLFLRTADSLRRAERERAGASCGCRKGI